VQCSSLHIYSILVISHSVFLHIPFHNGSSIENQYQIIIIIIIIIIIHKNKLAIFSITYVLYKRIFFVEQLNK